MSKQRHAITELANLQEDGDRVITEVDGQEIAVFRIKGELHALANYCPHQAGPLCEGKLRGSMSTGDDGWEWRYDDDKRNITCPWHAWKFDVTTGRNINDNSYAVPTYDVEIENDTVYILR
jgi:nitrite reductase/ring-hydroxylating ferredoxin subunit